VVDRQNGSIVDSYTALQAAQRAAEKSQKIKKYGNKKGAAAAPPPKSTKPKIASHIAKTVMPTKYEIICYDCGFSFLQTGRMKSAMCPQCKAMLNFIDYTIDQEWRDSLKTAGTVKITANGVVKSGVIIAGNVVMAGRIEGGEINALHQLHLKPDGQFTEAFITCKDLLLDAGIKLVLKKKFEFRHVEVAGDLKASFKASGLVAIKATGVIRGDVEAARLSIEEGGGLLGKMNIGQE